MTQAIASSRKAAVALYRGRALREHSATACHPNERAESVTEPTPASPQPGDRFFFCRLLPPRPSFAMDLTPDELAAMRRHAAYWTSLLARGTAIVFGPVADPAGPWGMGVLRLRAGESLESFVSQDPAILADIGLRYETTPMPKAIFSER